MIILKQTLPNIICAAFVYAHNRVIPTVWEHVVPEKAMRSCSVAVSVQESLDDGIVISGLQVIEARLLIRVVAVGAKMRSIQPSEKSEKWCEKAADLEVFKIVFRQHLRFLFKGMRPNPGRIPIWIKHSQAMQRTVAGAVGSSAGRSTFPFRRRKKEKPRQTKQIPDGFPLPS